MLDDWIFTALKQEVGSAKQRHQTAKDNFWRISAHRRELPRYTAGTPEPGSSQMLRDAVFKETQALNDYIEAMRRLNAYLLDGTVPPHLKEKEKSAGQ